MSPRRLQKEPPLFSPVRGHRFFFAGRLAPRSCVQPLTGNKLSLIIGSFLRTEGVRYAEEVLDDFRKKLLKKKKEILTTISTAKTSGTESLLEGAQDVADKALSSYSREMLYGLSDQERRVLQLVEDALQRLTDKTFGTCVHCGEKIQTRRMEAVPWARHCLDCQELQEKGYIK
jgi:DnaK suppressor protein